MIHLVHRLQRRLGGHASPIALAMALLALALLSAGLSVLIAR